MSYVEVDVFWEGPFDVTYDREERQYSLAGNVPKDVLEAHGFYQIYGDHPVYGKDVLLYIGETKPSKVGRRGFGQRMQEHFSGRFWYHSGLKVRFGRGYIDDVEVVERQQILAVESLLISSNMPALNREHLDQSNQFSKNYIVRNWDFKGSIVAECTGKYWAN
ncbi:hypothetical protein ABMY10_22450 [Vibrio vulnificus]|uniref:hypothetical protein n=1 Tax=Vibrio vulnificus TaxID=672 RepID=UPI0040583AF8